MVLILVCLCLLVVEFLWFTRSHKKESEYSTCQEYWPGDCDLSYTGNHYCEGLPKHRYRHRCKCEALL